MAGRSLAGRSGLGTVEARSHLGPLPLRPIPTSACSHLRRPIGLGTVEARIGASLPTHETRYGKEPTPREQTQDRHARLNHVLHDVTAALARHEAERWRGTTQRAPGGG